MDKPKVIATIGPGSNKHEILSRLKDRGIDYFRINLSHTEEEDIEPRVKDLLGYGIPIILDTEGSQVRSGNTKEIHYKEGDVVKVYNKKIECDGENIFLNPLGTVEKLLPGDLIFIDFNSLLMKVFDISSLGEGYVKCKVVIGGHIGGKKAVYVDSPTFKLPPFSKKDSRAIEIAKKYGITNFTLSFMEDAEDVRRFKERYPECNVYSKIESREGLNNFKDIAIASEGLLIDRGDLSTQVNIERIPFIQKRIIEYCRSNAREVFVATNTLEQMSLSLKPNRAEVTDIVNIVLDGATGIALTKEVAVGKYPVETINMLKSIISQIEYIDESKKDSLIEKIDDTDYLYSEDVPCLLVKPHGGRLVNRMNPLRSREKFDNHIECDEEELMDAEQIAIGAFSPIQGFMTEVEFNSVKEKMRLPNGTVWPIPLFLDVSEEESKRLNKGDKVGLKFEGDVYGSILIEDIYKVDKKEACKKIFGTDSLEHPGVKKFIESKEYFVGGKIELFKRRDSKHKMHELTPVQTRRVFTERGWSKVVGFHTRNVPHRSHEFIQIEGLKKGLCDGLFIHPVIGKKKSGDFESDIIIEAYDYMIDSVYPNGKAVLSTFASYSRYAGPREALFTALVRKNFGCSHFIVGRDHTGVKDFYDPEASHNIFSDFGEEEIDITPIKFGKVFYSDLDKKYIHEPDFIDHPAEKKLHLSGTSVREIFKRNLVPPEWFMRPEISKIVTERMLSGKKVFVE